MSEGLTLVKPFKLNKKQARFVAEYLIDGNASQAAVRAGYSKKNPNVVGPRLLAHVGIAAAIAAAQAKLATKLEITAERIIEETARVAFANLLDYVDVDELGGATVNMKKVTREHAAAIQELTSDHVGKRVLITRTKLRLGDKLTALANLAKLCGFWKDKSEVNVTFDHEGYLREVARRRLAARSGGQ